MPARYDISAYKKHKRPKGWASLCPKELHPDATPEQGAEDAYDGPNAQELLDTSVCCAGVRWNVQGEWCFRAFPHDEEPNGDTLWHGHPVPWTRLPTEAKNALVATKRLDPNVYSKAIRKGWGREFA